MAKRHAPGSVYKALDSLMKEIGAKIGANGYETAADFENVTHFTLYKQVDPDNPAEMSFARVARLTAHFGATAALEYLADQAGCIVLPKVSVAADSCLIKHLTTLTKEFAESTGATASLIADPNASDEVLAEAEKDANDLRKAAAALETAIRSRREANRTNVTKIRGAAA